MIQVRLDDGRVIQVNTDDREAAARAARRFQLKERFEAEAKEQHASQDLSLLGRFAVGAGRGFTDTIEGVKQIGREIVGDEEGIREQQERQALEIEEFNKIPGAENLLSSATLGRLVGGVASTPVPGGVGANLGTRLATAAGANALASGVQFVPEGGSRLTNAALGAALGAGGQGVAEGIGALANKAAQARAGNVANADVLATAQREGVPLGLDDLTQNPVADRIGTIMDRVPLLGTRGNREATQDALSNMITRRIGDVGDQSTLFEGLQQSAKRKLAQLTRRASRRYDDLADRLDPVGDVQLNNMGREITEKLQKNVLDTNTEDLLVRIGGGSADNFSQARNLRRDISNLIDKNLDDPAYVHLLDVKRALERDMREHAVANGGEALWRRADDFYRTQVIPIKTRALKRAVNSDDPSKVWRLLVSTQGVRGGSPQASRRMWQALDAKGRRLARQGLFDDAFRAATKQGEFSPAVMSNQLQARANIIKQFAKTDDIDGLIKLLKHTKKAGRLGENPPTGNRIMDVLLFGGALAQPVEAASALLTGRFLFFNPRARNFLAAANRATPGSAKMNQIVNRMAALTTRAGAVGQAQPER